MLLVLGWFPFASLLLLLVALLAEPVVLLTRLVVPERSENKREVYLELF